MGVMKTCSAGISRNCQNFAEYTGYYKIPSEYGRISRNLLIHD